MADYTYDYNVDGNVPQYGDNPTMKSNGRGLRDVVQFQPNVPVQLNLKYAKAKRIDTKRGVRYMVTTQDNRVAFLDASASLAIEKLSIRPGELFWVCFRQESREDLGSWDVYLDPSTERARESRQPAQRPSPEIATPTAGVPLDNNHHDTVSIHATATAATKKAGAKGGAPAETPVSIQDDSASQIRLGWAQLLISVTNTLVDCYAVALEHAKVHGAAVRNEDVRALLTTAFIQQCSRKGSPDVA